MIAKGAVIRSAPLASTGSLVCAAVFAGAQARWRRQAAWAKAVGRPTKDNCSWVVTDSDGATTVPGVWAAGKVTDPSAQLLSAAESGSRAGIAINADLVDEDVSRAVAERRSSNRGPS